MKKTEREMYIAANEAEKIKDIAGKEATKEGFDVASDLRDEQLVEMIEKSPIKEAYHLLGARSPLELNHLYSEEDQNLIRNGGFLAFDYENSELKINQIKNILEGANREELDEEEQKWRDQILWFWHHHAISAAITRGDKERAREFSEKALELGGDDNPNKLTRLFYYLVHDRREDAEKYIQELKESGYPEEDIGEDVFEAFYADNPFSGHKDA